MSAHQFEPNTTRFAAPGTTANIYVSGLPERYNDYQLRALFEQFGKVQSAKMMCYSASSNKPRGTGFVLFDNTESPIEAVKALNNTVLEGQSIEVCFAKAHRQGEKPQPKKQFSTPLPPPLVQNSNSGFQVQGFNNPVTFQPQPFLPGFEASASKKTVELPQYQVPAPLTQQPQPSVVIVQQVIQPDGQVVYVIPSGTAPAPALVPAGITAVPTPSSTE